MIELRVKRQTEPEAEPLDLAEVKAHLRADLDYTGEDSLIEGYVSAAREEAEKYCNRAFAEGSFFCTVETLPRASTPLTLSDPAMTEVTSVSYRDETGERITLAPDTYELDTFFLAIRPISEWPTYSTEVIIEYRAGYLATQLPKTVKQAILLLVTDFYTNRSSQVVGQLNANPAAESLLHKNRVGLGI